MSTQSKVKTEFPPGPRRRYPGEHFFQFRRNPAEAMLGLSRQAPVVGLRLGTLRVVSLAQPALIHQVLVSRHEDFAKGQGQKALKKLLGEGLLTSEGDLHRCQRKIMQPVFQAQKVGTFGPAIGECTASVLDRWPDQGVISAGPEMTRLTLEIVGRCLFGSDLKEDVAEVRSALEEGMKLFRLANLPFAEWLEKLVPPLRWRLQNTRERLEVVVRRLIEEHRACPHHDLLDQLMTSGMSDSLLRDETMTLFLAGHETTAHALTFALYLLSRHPGERAWLQEELDALHRPLQVEDLATLPRLRQVLLETLRLYPPAWILGRQALHDLELGGYQIPRGSLVLMSPFAMHRNPLYFEEPERFWPQRWERHPRCSLAKGVFFPFGMGPRVCLGEHFAWLEMMLGLGQVLQNFELGTCAVENPRLRPRVTLAPEEELLIPVRRRSRSEGGQT